jgi:hypothetical protein
LITLLTELTWSSLDVLFSHQSRNVTWHQIVLLHSIRFQPDTHRIGLGTHGLGTTYTLYTLDGRDNIDICVVRQELLIILTFITGYREASAGTGLTFHGLTPICTTSEGNKALSLLYTVLHIDGSHICIDALFEIDRYHTHTVIGGG